MDQILEIGCYPVPIFGLSLLSSDPDLARFLRQMKLVGLDGCEIGSWAKVELRGGDSVARFAERACTKFPYSQVTASGASLHRVEWTGAGDPDAAAVSAALCRVHLPSRMTLDEAGIKPGTCVIVRKIVGAAAFTVAAGGGQGDVFEFSLPSPSAFFGRVAQRAALAARLCFTLPPFRLGNRLFLHPADGEGVDLPPPGGSCHAASAVCGVSQDGHPRRSAREDHRRKAE